MSDYCNEMDDDDDDDDDDDSYDVVVVVMPPPPLEQEEGVLENQLGEGAPAISWTTADVLFHHHHHHITQPVVRGTASAMLRRGQRRDGLCDQL